MSKKKDSKTSIKGRVLAATSEREGVKHKSKAAYNSLFGTNRQQNNVIRGKLKPITPRGPSK